MDKIDYIKERFGEYYQSKGPENGILQGFKYNGAATHCRACLNCLTRMVRAKRVLEIGSWRFECSNAMAEGILTNFPTGENCVVDTFDIRPGGYDSSTDFPKHDLVKAHIWMPFHTTSDRWKYEHASLSQFKEFSNEQIYRWNRELLINVSGGKPYDLVFIDGDHSLAGISFDWQLIHESGIMHPETLIVIDNIWDKRLREVREFFYSLEYKKWDFAEWNDANLTEVQDTGILIQKYEK